MSPKTPLSRRKAPRRARPEMLGARDARLLTDNAEHKQAEEALLASERRFSELIRYSSDSVTVLDENGMQVFVSNAVERMLGYKPAELMNIPVIEEMIHPDDQERVKAAFAAIIKDGVGGAQYRHRHKDGSWVPLEAWGTNQLGNPDICGVVVNVRDITEHKRAEEAQSRSERLLRKLLESMHEGVWAMGADRRTTFVNERLCAMLGYSTEELQGMTHLDVLDGAQKLLALEWFQERRLGRAGVVNCEIVRKDGTRFPAQIMSSPMLDAKGCFEGLVSGVVDLTERKRMEGELRRNQARFEALFELSRLTTATEAQAAAYALREALRLTDSASGALFCVSPDGTKLVPLASEGGQKGGGVPSFPTAGASPWAAVFASRQPMLVNDFSAYAGQLPPGHPPVTRFLAVPALDGDRPAVILGLTGKASPYTPDDSLQVSLLLDGMWRVLRGRRDEARIRASLSEKEALLREVQHRVKNNLQVVSSLLDMAGRRLAGKEARQGLEEVRAKVQAMSLVHAQLHDEGATGDMDLERYVRALFRQLREVYSGGLELSLHVQFDPLVLGPDQAVPLGLALNEALANVFKHSCGPGQCGTGRAGRVDIRAWQEPDGLLNIEICDDGPGLPAGLIPERAGSLGMKLMHGLVRRQLGGELDIDSRPADAGGQGGGVCVRIRFRPNIAK